MHYIRHLGEGDRRGCYNPLLWGVQSNMSVNIKGEKYLRVELFSAAVKLKRGRQKTSDLIVLPALRPSPQRLSIKMVWSLPPKKKREVPQSWDNIGKMIGLIQGYLSWVLEVVIVKSGCKNIMKQLPLIRSPYYLSDPILGSIHFFVSNSKGTTKQGPNLLLEFSS